MPKDKVWTFITLKWRICFAFLAILIITKTDHSVHAVTTGNQIENANVNANTPKPQAQGFKLALGIQPNASATAVLHNTDASRKLSISHSRGKPGMRVAVIGGGISGASAAYFLRSYLDPVAMDNETKVYREFEMYRSLTERAGGRVTLPRSAASYTHSSVSQGLHGGTSETSNTGQAQIKYSGLTIDVFEKSAELGGRLRHVYQKPKWNLTKLPFVPAAACVDANRKPNPDVHSSSGLSNIKLNEEGSSYKSDFMQELEGRGFVDTCSPSSSDRFAEDVSVESGPFEFPASNEMLLTISQRLGLEAVSSPSSRERTVLRNESETLYESSTWPTVTLARLVWRYGLSVPKLKELVSSFVQRFRTLYHVLAGQSTNVWDGFCFGTIEELLHAADPILLSSTQLSLIDALKLELGQDEAVNRLINEVVASLTRAQLNQTPFIHALAGYMSLVPALGSIENYALRGGSARLIEGLLHVSGAFVRLKSRVIAIEAVDRRDSLHIHMNTQNDETKAPNTLGGNKPKDQPKSAFSHPFEYRVTYIDSEGNTFHRCYDYVIVAAPFPLSGPNTTPSPALSKSRSTTSGKGDAKSSQDDSKFGTLAGIFPSLKELRLSEQQKLNEAGGASSYRTVVSNLISTSIGHITGTVDDYRSAHHGRGADGGNLVNAESMGVLSPSEIETRNSKGTKDHPIILGPEFPRHQFVKKQNPYEVTYVTLLQGIPNATYFESHMHVEGEGSISDAPKIPELQRSDQSQGPNQNEADHGNNEKDIVTFSNSEVDIETFAALRELIGLQVNPEDLLPPGLLGDERDEMLRAVEAVLPPSKASSDMAALPGIILTTEPRSLSPESVYAAFVRSQVALGLPGTNQNNNVNSRSHSRLFRAQAMARQAGLSDELEIPGAPLKDTETKPGQDVSVPMLVSVHMTSMIILRRHQLRIVELIEHAIIRRRQWLLTHYPSLEGDKVQQTDGILKLLEDAADQYRQDNIRESALKNNLEMWRVRLTSRGPLSREFVQRIFPVRSPGALQFAWFSHPRLTSQARFETIRLRLNPQRALRRRGPIFESSDKELVGATAATGARVSNTVDKPLPRIRNSNDAPLSSEIASRVYYVSAGEEAVPFAEFMLIVSQNTAKMVARDILGGESESSTLRKSLDFEASSPYSRVSEVQRSFGPDDVWSDDNEFPENNDAGDGPTTIPSLPMLDDDETFTTVAESYEESEGGIDVNSAPRLRQLMKPGLNEIADPNRLLEIQIPSEIIHHAHHSREDNLSINSFAIKSKASRVQETMSNQQPTVVVASRIASKSVISNANIDKGQEVDSSFIVEEIDAEAELASSIRNGKAVPLPHQKSGGEAKSSDIKNHKNESGNLSSKPMALGGTKDQSQKIHPSPKPKPKGKQSDDSAVNKVAAKANTKNSAVNEYTNTQGSKQTKVSKQNSGAEVSKLNKQMNKKKEQKETVGSKIEPQILTSTPNMNLNKVGSHISNDETNSTLNKLNLDQARTNEETATKSEIFSDTEQFDKDSRNDRIKSDGSTLSFMLNWLGSKNREESGHNTGYRTEL